MARDATTTTERSASSAATDAPVLRDFVGGEWVESRATDHVDVFNPATGAVIARTPLGTRADVDAAVAAAKAAFPAWRATPVGERSRAMFAFKNRLEEHFDELARIVTTEHGKTLDESRGSVRRGIEAVEVACGMPSMMMGYGLEDIARGIDCDVHRQPMGVFAAIAPFNFPSMVPLWFLPFAIATGNTFVVKPSEQVPLSQKRIFELLDELRPARRREHRQRRRGRRERPLRAPRHRGRLVRRLDARREARLPDGGARGQARAGARRREELHRRDGRRRPGQVDRHRLGVLLRLRGRAVPRGLRRRDRRRREPPRGRARAARRRARRRSRSATASSRASRWARSSARRHRGRVLSYIEKGVAEGAELVLDGRGLTVKGREHGFFLGADDLRQGVAEITIGRDEIFGPVLSLMNARTSTRRSRSLSDHPQANATSIYTSSGRSARAFAAQAPPRWSASTSASRRRWRSSPSAARRAASSATSRPTAATHRVLHGQNVDIERWW